MDFLQSLSTKHHSLGPYYSTFPASSIAVSEVEQLCLLIFYVRHGAMEAQKTHPVTQMYTLLRVRAHFFRFVRNLSLHKLWNSSIIFRLIHVVRVWTHPNMCLCERPWTVSSSWTEVKVGLLYEGLIQSPLALPAAVADGGSRAWRSGGAGGRRMRESRQGQTEKVNSDMTVTNCLVFIQIV